MHDREQFIPIAGFIATVAMAAYMVVQLSAQGEKPVGDFSSAAVAEVHDAQGRVLLRGAFAAVPEADNDIERKARLESTGIDADAIGEAEVEVSTEPPREQEIEFSVENLQPGTALIFLIDGQTIGSGTVDRRGRADVEIDLGEPGSAASR